MVLLSLLAVAALPPGWLLITRPDGSGLGLPLVLLAQSPFSDYRVPGLVLFGVIGLGALAGAVLAACDHRWAPRATQLVGLLLVGWIAVQVGLIGDTSFLQPVMGLWGFLLLALGWWWKSAAAARA